MTDTSKILACNLADTLHEEARIYMELSIAIFFDKVRDQIIPESSFQEIQYLQQGAAGRWKTVAGCALTLQTSWQRMLNELRGAHCAQPLADSARKFKITQERRKEGSGENSLHLEDVDWMSREDDQTASSNSSFLSWYKNSKINDDS